MRDVEEIREDLLTAKALQSLSNHNGYHDLVGQWKRHFDRLLKHILHHRDWNPMEMGHWQGRMDLLDRWVRLAENTTDRIVKLEEEMEMAKKSEAVPKLVRDDTRPPRWGTE